jgi:regulator of cell morphogenesis and NO signaling
MKENDIPSFYETDHDRLDGLFREYQYFKRTDYAKAKECFRQFKFGLQRHIIWEEEILFPLFEQKTGMTEGGPTSVMRLEHRHIEKYFEAIHKKVKTRDPNTEEEEQQLLDTLTMHHLKEERILYPAIERLVNDEERAEVFAAMESIPPERYSSCCRQEPTHKHRTGKTTSPE